MICWSDAAGQISQPDGDRSRRPDQLAGIRVGAVGKRAAVQAQGTGRVGRVGGNGIGDDEAIGSCRCPITDTVSV